MKDTTRLFNAVTSGDFNVAKELIAARVDVNRPTRGKTPLIRAVEKRHLRIVRLLLANGANTESTYKSFTPLHLAAQVGAGDIVRELLAATAIPNARDKEGLTPLMHAAEAGRIAVVELLLNHGVDIEEKDSLGYTALSRAVFGAKPKAVRILLVRGADPNVVTSVVQNVVSPGHPVEYHDRTPLQLVDAVAKSADWRFSSPSSLERHARACAEMKEMLTQVPTNGT